MVVKKENDKFILATALGDLWNLLTNEQRATLLQNATIEKFRKSQIIYREGEQPEKLMCLLDGKVKIYKDGIGGRNQIIRMAKPVEYFGYRAYFAEEKYKTSASAFELSTICFIPMNTIADL